MTLLRIDKASNPIDPFLEWLSAGAREVFNEETFKRMIAIERKRTERSREPFLLMLLEAGKREGSERNETVLDRVLSVLPVIYQRNRRNRLVQRPDHRWCDVYRACTS